MPPSYLVLCGPMGAGKSTVGARLAAVVGCPFDDLDAAVERITGRTVSGIFAEEGEAAFRAIEERCALGLLSAPCPRVIALGGGTLTSSAVRERCRDSDVLLVWLRITPETAAARLAGEEGGTRPLWRDGGVQRWSQLVASRAGHWSEAGLVLDADALSPTQAAQILEQHWEVLGVR